MRLKDKVALLTGAAAAIEGELMGFGGAAAHKFLREGAKVILTDIRDELGESSAKKLQDQGADVIYQHLDVTSEKDWINAFKIAETAYGQIDILFNNAGIARPIKIENLTEEIWDLELGVHAKGTFLGTKTAIPATRRGGGRSIKNK